MFKKCQIKEIYMNVGGVELGSYWDQIGNRRPAAAHLLANQTEVEVVEWSMLRDDPTGYMHDKRGSDDFLWLRDIASTPRPSLKSLKISGFRKTFRSALYSISSIKALLISASNLREFGFGLLSFEEDTALAKDINNEVFEGFTDWRMISNSNTPGNISITYDLFRFINVRCKFNGFLTSLKLENASFIGHHYTAYLVRSTFKLEGLRKLVLLDCKGLSPFLEALSPGDMKLEMLYLEFRIDDSDCVEQFVDALPAGRLKDLALMQWGGGLTIISCIKLHAPFLRSLVLDARQGFPMIMDHRHTFAREPQRPGDYKSVPIDESNDPAELEILFSAMKNLQELGICVSLDELSISIAKDMKARNAHQQEEDRPVDLDVDEVEKGLDSSTSRPFLTWLRGSILPHLHTFQLRSVRTPKELKNPVNMWINNATIHKDVLRNEMAADAGYLHFILPKTVRKIILGCKRPAECHYNTPKIRDDLHRWRRGETEEEHKARIRLMFETRDQERIEAVYPALYMVRKGEKSERYWNFTDVGWTSPVGMVLPLYEKDAWRFNFVMMGDPADGKNGRIWESNNLPQTWRDVGSSVYEAAWSR